MKKTQTFKYCEFCDNALLDVNPPTNEQYEQGMITILGGNICFGEALSEKRKSHVGYFDGTYCNHVCLISKILELLRP